MALEAIDKEVSAALHRITKKNPDFKKRLENAYGYVVFPSVGRASLVLGATFGRGQVFEHSQPVGYASMGQVTLGVQVGGDTFSELVLFNSRDAFERFKRGRYAFTANASAAIVRAAAAGTINFEKDVVAQAFGRGGMILEISLGAQKFNFRKREEPRTDRGLEEQRGREADGKQAKEPARAEATQPDGQQQEPEQEAEQEPEHRGIGARARAMVAAATSKVGRVPSKIARRYRHQHP